MPRGRIPTPKAINDLKGDPGKRRTYQTEPAAPAGIPACPSYLDKTAKAEWKFICQQLKQMQLLSVADKTALELYCKSYSLYRKAEKKLKVEEEVIETGKQGYLQKNPWLTILDQQSKIMKSFLIEFGLTPSARSRLSVKEESPEATGTAAFFRMSG